ncbi:hypothetical protein Lal_00030124 [Lupinus albus]|nr:hypothetical protein Lal_00030124 [Lupinus albus]
MGQIDQLKAPLEAIKAIFNNLVLTMVRRSPWLPKCPLSISSCLWQPCMQGSKVSSIFQRFGMVLSEKDPSMFYKCSSSSQCNYLLVYVDDIVITSNNRDSIKCLKQEHGDQIRLLTGIANGPGLYS